MKILVFSPYYPPHIGGLENHADEFNKYISQKGVDIFVFTPRLPVESVEEEMKYNKVKIIRFPAFEIIANYPLPKFWSIKFWKLFRDLFEENFDIVISRTRFFSTSLLALIYSKIKKKKWIHIEHGSDFVKLNNKFKGIIAKIYDYTFGKIVLIFSDKNIANSQASARFCKKIAKNKDCIVIYRGVEINKIEKIQPNFDLKRKYKNSFIITFVGRLIDGKGVFDLIGAAKDIQEENTKLFIIGDGPQKNNLKKLTEKFDIQEKVIFFGYRKFEEIIAILKISDIFVNPSYTEGLPTSVIEAGLCNVPIIATNVGGTSEIIENEKSGFLINKKNILELKEKIEILYNNINLREDFSKQAFQKIKNNFDWKKSVEIYLEVFTEIKK